MNVINIYKFSIIICTLNRSKLLNENLSHFKDINYSKDYYELLIVDNGSTDNTKHVALEFIKNNKQLNISYHYESNKGLHNARHLGAKKSNADILLYIDDDIEINKDILKIHYNQIYNQFDIKAAGGPISVKWDENPQQWISDLGSFGELYYGNDIKILPRYTNINGGNYSIYKSVLFELGGFNPDTAVDDPFVLDGEIGLCNKIYNKNYTIGYHPKSIVYHKQYVNKVDYELMKNRLIQIGKMRATLIIKKKN